MKAILFRYEEVNRPLPKIAFEVTQDVMDGKVELPDGLKPPVCVIGVMMIHDKYGNEHEVKLGSWMYRTSYGSWPSAYTTARFQERYRLLGRCNEIGCLVDSED